MKTLFTTLATFLFLCAPLAAQKVDPVLEKNWHHWRGPYEKGVAPDSDPPLAWSESQNIKWKTAVPGKGHATPIIWKDNIILLSAVPTDKKVTQEQPEEGNDQDWMQATSTDLIHEFTVFCLDRNSGKIKWETVVKEDLPHSSTHEFGSWASNSPTTDGERIYAYFGSMGLYCLDFKGNILWERDFGKMEKVMSFGEGSSPYLYKDQLIVLRDHQGQSSIHVLNKLTGKVIWEKERDEISSWSTPTVVEYKGTPQLITSATNRIRSYDLSSGEIIWEATGLTRNVIPSPLYENGLVFLMSGFRGTASMAVDLSKAKGDITGTDAIVWRYDINTPYTPGPVLADGTLYFLRANNGFLTALDAATGKPYYEAQNMDGVSTVFTSPLAAGGRLYIMDVRGNTAVVKMGETFELLTTNKLDDAFIASPVALGGELYLRGEKSLYCIAE